MSFANFAEGVGFATAAIVFFEIKFDYALGDKLKDFSQSAEKRVVGLAAKAEAFKTKAETLAKQI